MPKDIVTIRRAGPMEAATVHRFVLGLATYEGHPEFVHATPDDYRRAMESTPPGIVCLLAQIASEAAGLAMLVPRFTSYAGRQLLHLEDLFVHPQHRKAGVGKALLSAAAKLARDGGYDRMEWWVGATNDPAIAFYERLGGQVMEHVRVCRLDGDALERLAEQGPPVAS